MSYSDRSEPRIEVTDYEFMHFKFADNPDIVIKTLLLNKSESGLGCQYIGAIPLKQNQQLICENGQTYTIAWIGKSEGHSKCFGLGMEKSFKLSPFIIESHVIDELDKEIMERITSIITSFKVEANKNQTIHIYTIGDHVEKLNQVEFTTQSIIFFKGKMKNVLPHIKGFANRFALISIESDERDELLKRVIRFFLKEDPEKLTERKVLTHSKLRSETIDRIVEQYPELSPRDRNKIETMLEEMLMNGFYDAPTDERGINKYASYDRNEAIILNDDEALELTFQHKGSLLWLQVKDLFGSFPPAILLRYLKKCLCGDEKAIDTKPGGAGLGLYMMWRNAHSLFVRVQPGVKTTFTCSVDTGSSNKKSRSQTCLVQCID